MSTLARFALVCELRLVVGSVDGVPIQQVSVDLVILWRFDSLLIYSALFYIGE